MDHMSIITQVSNPKEEEIISFNQEKASQSNSSLKKQRSRSIFSTFFCCFRNYNVEPPATNSSSLPPPVEENGSPPKCDQVEVIPVPSVCIASIFSPLHAGWVGWCILSVWAPQRAFTLFS
ncbi:E3 SUMO-protein ligase SIZ2 [Xenotaenia resolanae]|uniref:E3 SUMO-protein ligase SIZ2 n=1 Tax=Xenotaenia resolanae TaxID=208358 RepID=A0ABV0WZE6_9TELE